MPSQTIHPRGLWRSLRGIYSAGGYEVTTKHWWSPRDRKAAQLAARIIEHEAPKIDAEVRRRITESMIYGRPLGRVPENEVEFERTRHLLDEDTR